MKFCCSLEEYEDARKQAIDHLRYSTSAAERKTWSVALKEDSKTLWGKINWKGTVDINDESEFPDLEDLRDQFLMKSETTDKSTLLSEVKQNQHVPVLDDDITIEEIKKAHTKAKEGKSTADRMVG